MVVVLGVAIFSSAAGASSGLACLAKVAIWRLAEYPQPSPQQQGVFADWRQVHVFVGQVAAHNPGV